MKASFYGIEIKEWRINQIKYLPSIHDDLKCCYCDYDIIWHLIEIKHTLHVKISKKT